MENQTRREEALDFIARGKTLYGMDRFEDALAYYKRAEGCDGRNPDVYLGEGECLIMLDRFAEAKSAYEKLLLIDKNSAQALFHLGNVAFLQGDGKTGREYYAKALNAGFDDPQLYLNLGFMQINEGMYEECVSAFNKALAMNKFLPEAWLNKAKAYMAMNKLDEALQALEGMIQYTPEYFEGHHYKFIVLLNQGQREEAEATLQQMERLFPDDMAVRMDRLHYLEVQGDAPKALAYLEENFPGDVSDELRMEKAKILCGVEGRDEEALALLCQLFESGKEALRGEAGYFGMSLAYSTGRLSEAKKLCEALLERPERDSNYYNALYMRAQILDRLGGAAEAKEAYQFAADELRMATAENPDAMDLYLLRVLTLRGLRRLQDALDLVNYILSVNPNSVEALFVRMQIYEEMHLKAEAAADRKRIAGDGGLTASLFQAMGLQ